MNIKKEVLMGNILLEALETKDACNGCFYISKGTIYCIDCHEFIVSGSGNGFCPCRRYGKAEARKLSWIALEERGII